MPRFVRSQNIPKFNDHTKYKPYLRVDFRRQCAYCELTEASVFGIETFGVDHFRPKKLFPDLTFVYENLYYCCNDCNRYKGPVWPSAERIAEGYFFPDPCECDPHKDHLRELADSRLEPVSKAGVFALEVLRLNREPCLRFRKRRRNFQQRAAGLRALLHLLEPGETKEVLRESLNQLEIECGELLGH